VRTIAHEMISVAVYCRCVDAAHAGAWAFIDHGGGWRCSGFASWERNSEVIHSEAASPEGPFEASNVASPPWTHNPTVTKINNT
jgi:hypothetical protein